ncbi:hypothetical protein CC1G_08011 [Coprinopsis cinerea okayama7|uniref:Uncharacterized protein n=1 Tax=Coprinopsis cinerea (strain Okayama-7 / 130 / ATCC MYA-4618 / FGSC 9003) TaxID=240176 RepID=A8NQ92_COPC7|nr:hypothetical protein CC1G_08011 [Coprinopsis cinerea okayama7\|eukprot:XP_001835502.2 hypothetical protein CC1G_08011 [Coprinopsis cinerea okayama7\
MTSPTRSRRNSLTLVSAVAVALCVCAVPTEAHVAAWGPGMYCRGGNVEGVDDNNSNAIVQPLYNLTKSDWWFHAVNDCDKFPPPPGEFLELPANGEVTLEIAVNRAFTSTCDNPVIGEFPHGRDEFDEISEEGCITNPNIHTKSEVEATGTALAISYATTFERVNADNLVVFSVLYHTPWRRLATYQVPNLPACPPAGCYCAWGWLPDSCGQPDMYMEPFRCKVINPPKSASVMVGRAKPPVWCEDDQKKCRMGPKQMIYWNQLDGNNVEVEGLDLDGNPKRPVYNYKMGFMNGAQTDIFL